MNFERANKVHRPKTVAKSRKESLGMPKPANKVQRRYFRRLKKAYFAMPMLSCDKELSSMIRRVKLDKSRIRRLKRKHHKL